MTGSPTPLERLTPPRVGPFREETFRSPLHSVRVASILGISLGVTFTVCFLTGFLSHLIQHPPSFYAWPARPGWLYRVSQGVHVTTGIASIPLLLAKLWTVYPRFWTWPPLRSAAHAIERLALLPLVGGSLFLLFTGVGSISRWFPWDFSFPPAHYAAAWITIGALIVHVGAKAGAARRALSGRSPDVTSEAVADERGWGGLSRRGFLGAAFGGAAALVVATRFPRDAAARYAAEPDFDDWGDRLEVFGLDLRHTPSVEAFCTHLLESHDRLDYVVNNACQTVRRPPEFYRHMMELELGALDDDVARLVGPYEGVRRSDMLGSGGSPLGGASSLVGLRHAAELSQAALLPDDAAQPGHLFPDGVLDQDLQQVDLRDQNSWRLRLAEVSTVELLETQLVNAIAPTSAIAPRAAKRRRLPIIRARNSSAAA